MTLQNFGYVPLRYYNLEKLLENNIPGMFHMDLIGSLWVSLSDNTYPLANYFSKKIKRVIT